VNAFLKNPRPDPSGTGKGEEWELATLSFLEH
jgi:hypothetical protein